MTATAVAKESRRQLPAGWRWVKLGDICKGPGQYGTSTKSNGDERGVPVLGMYHIHEGRIRWENVSHVDLQADELSKYRLLKGDLLFNRTNSAELVGKTAVYDTDRSAVFASYLIRFRLIEGTADSHFVSAFINSPGGRRFIEGNMARAIGQVNISASAMRIMPVPVPPLAEQRRIARVLREQMAAVERVRAAAQARLEAAKELPAAFLSQIFPQPGYPLPADWRWVRLGDHAVKIGSGLTPLGGQAAYVASGISLVRSQNVRMNGFSMAGLAYITEEQDRAMSESRVQAQDVLLNITGASIGRVCVVPETALPANVNQHVSIIRSDGSLDPWFLSLFLSTSQFQERILKAQAGATRQALTKSLIAAFEIPLAPIEDQRRIASGLREQMGTAEAACAAAEAELNTINALPAALLRRAFNGEI
ncbi:MAG TPA: restriction endonuclease subunit S [bacterium]